MGKKKREKKEKKHHRNKHSKAFNDKVSHVMHEKHLKDRWGHPITDRKRKLAVGYSEARKRGYR